MSVICKPDAKPRGRRGGRKLKRSEKLVIRFSVRASQAEFDYLQTMARTAIGDRPRAILLGLAALADLIGYDAGLPPGFSVLDLDIAVQAEQERQRLAAQDSFSLEA